MLTEEQRVIYQEVEKSVRFDSGKLFFVDAPGGTGKTFLMNLLLASVRLQGFIALAVASSGIAATLLDGGRTAHSMFKLPLALFLENPTCQIPRGSAKAKLLQDTKLIIWDECTMSHKAAFEAVDRTIRDIKNNNKLMGGITMVLAGDFRQTLPVIPKGTKTDEIKACLKSSSLWQKVTSLRLTTNMRVHIQHDLASGQFAQQLISLGEGKISTCPNDGLINLPFGNCVRTLKDLEDMVFPSLIHNFSKMSWLAERAILAPKNESVNEINDHLLQQLPGAVQSYNSIDSMTDPNESVHYPVEFLNSLNPSGFPPHHLKLKTGAPIMLLRNLDPPKLCNGTRLIVSKMMNNVLEAKIMTGRFQ